LALTNPLKGFFSAKAARGFGRPVLAAAASMMLWMADVTTLLKVSVSVWSGFDGTGSLLATLNLPANAVGCPDFGDADLCPFTSAQVTFAGVARSVQFSGISAEFDDIRFTAAPEPSTWAMTLIGFAGLGYAAIRGKRLGRSRPA
jgi:hypothetical protein